MTHLLLFYRKSCSLRMTDYSTGKSGPRQTTLPCKKTWKNWKPGLKSGAWKLKFNAKKCHIVSVWHKSPFFYQLDKHIVRVATQPYLGVKISENLSWSVHVDKITKKANASLGMLRRNLRFCPETCRKTAYTSLIRSLLEYSSTVWDPHVQKEIDKRELRRYPTQSSQIHRLTLPIQKLRLCHSYASGARSTFTARKKTTKPAYLPLQDHRRTSSWYRSAEISNSSPQQKIDRPTRSENQVQKNAVQQFARNHQRCFHIQHASTPVFKNNFFPRTIGEWNNLDSSVVSARTVGEF